MLAEPIETTLELGVPLSEVTFCAVDLETTGGSPREDSITEIGAADLSRRRAARHLPVAGEPRPADPAVRRPSHRHRRPAGVRRAADRADPSGVLEFARGAVIVAHNASFDFSFLNEHLRRLDYPPLPGPPVCTAKLARRVVWPDVPNVKLRTLAQYFRTRTQPTHRALADAEACAEVLHGLLDLGGRLGILTLAISGRVPPRGQAALRQDRLAARAPPSAGRLPVPRPRGTRSSTSARPTTCAPG